MTDASKTAFYAGLPKRRMGAGALITDGSGKVLIVQPTYKDQWEPPGGIVEAGETPAQACIRECREELGLRLDIRRLLVIEHQTEGGVRGDSIMFIYDGGMLADLSDVTLAADELKSAGFFGRDDLASRLSARLARRLNYALDARRDGMLIELENGVPRR